MIAAILPVIWGRRDLQKLLFSGLLLLTVGGLPVPIHAETSPERSHQHQDEQREIEQLWQKIEGSRRRDKKTYGEDCQRLRDLAARCPALFSDYLVAANTYASLAYSNKIQQWDQVLAQAKDDMCTYGHYLSDPFYLDTRALLNYETCRKLDITGDASEALLCYEQVWELLPEQHVNANLLSVYRQVIPLSLIHLYLFTGAYKEALHWLKVIEPYIDLEDPYFSSQLAHLRAKIHETQEHEWEPRHFYKLAHQFYLQLEDFRTLSHFTENAIDFSNFYLHRDQLDSALLVFNQAARYGPFADWSQVYMDYQQAQIMLAQDKPEEALTYARQCLGRINGLISENNYWKARALGVLGEAWAKKGCWEESLDTIQQALIQLSAEPTGWAWDQNPGIRSSNTKLDLLKMLVLKARVLQEYYYAEGGRNPALLQASQSTYAFALGLIKVLRAEYNDDEVKEYLSRKSYAIFESGLRTATALYAQTRELSDLQQVFNFFEANKALSLFENLKGIEAREEVNLPDSLIRQENALKYTIAKQEMLLRENQDSIAAEVGPLLSANQSSYKALMAKIKADYPDYYRLKYDTKTIAIKDIRQLLQKDESMVEYFYGEEHIYALLITPEEEGVYEFSAAGMDQQIDEFVQSISLRRSLNDIPKLQNYLREGYAIYERLLEPLPIQTEKLIIIPDGKLHYLPFVALPMDTLSMEEVTDPKELPYLIHKRTVRRNFSASVWYQQEVTESTKQNRKGSILVIAPEAFPKNSDLAVDTVRLKAEFGEDVDIVTNPRKEQVKALLAQGYETVFIFTHASAAADQPYLELMQDSLFLQELYFTPMTANFVILGACETGLGKNRKGEGVISLGRGFAYQNVPNTLMTLWQVEELASLRLSTKILQLHIQEALSPSEALHEVQLAILKDPDSGGEPFLWAGFVCTGR